MARSGQTVDVYAGCAEPGMYSFYCLSSLATAPIYGLFLDDNGQTIGIFQTGATLISGYNFTFASIAAGTDGSVLWATRADGYQYTYANDWGKVAGAVMYPSVSGDLQQITYTTGAKVNLLATGFCPVVGEDTSFGRVV